MVSHFTEQLEQMNHQSIPKVFKSILAHRHSVSCLMCVVHLNRHVRTYVMWRVCLLKSASLIMVFPSISESLPHPPPSWRPYLFGAGCFTIKTPWWVLLLPSLAPSAACKCISRLAHCLLYHSFVSWYIFNTFRKHSVCHSSGETVPKRNVSYFPIIFISDRSV